MIVFPTKHYIVFDFETTGTDPEKDEVVEISAMKYNNGEKYATMTMLVRPTVPISSEASAVTGITNELVETNGKNPAEAWKLFREFIEELPLIGHNILRFDYLFLKRALSRYNLKPI